MFRPGGHELGGRSAPFGPSGLRSEGFFFGPSFFWLYHSLPFPQISKKKRFASSSLCHYNQAVPYKVKEEQLEYQRKWMAHRRSEWIQANGPCIDCGAWEKLEIHHKDPRQKVMHALWSYRAERRKAELKKCEVVCRACHGKKTREYRRATRILIHGTVSAYENGCKCEICRMFYAGYRKSFPSRQPRHILKRKKENSHGTTTGT